MDETEIGDELAAFARLGLSSHWRLSRPSAVEAFFVHSQFSRAAARRSNREIATVRADATIG